MMNTAMDNVTATLLLDIRFPPSPVTDLHCQVPRHVRTNRANDLFTEEIFDCSTSSILLHNEYLRINVMFVTSCRANLIPLYSPGRLLALLAKFRDTRKFHV